MTSDFVSLKRKPTWLQSALPAIAGLAALMASADHAGAGSARSVDSVESRTAGEPIMAIVSLHSQRITVYDANGWILRAPVSSGQKGRETPAGIFSVIQKEAEHYSNLYDDAYMPHMQRITWSGIALHGGSLPGYPASHGCVRMPFDVAARLFDATQLGMRVIVAPNDVEPVEIADPALFLPKPGAGALAAARAAEADEAARKADQARLAAGTAFREAARAMVPVRTAENLKLRAEAQLAAAETARETALGSAISAEAKPQAEDARAKAVAEIAELQAQLAAAKAELQPKLDALTAAREAAVVAEKTQAAATEAARQTARELEPVSVLISRKTQRLYVRQAFEPIFETPVTILDAERPIGTHIFTALERTSGDTNIRWNVVSLGGGGLHGGAVEPHGRVTAGSGRDIEPMLTEPDSAKTALDRIVIPQDALDRIPGMAPRSTLIITDEGLSSETGKGTDFVVLLSGEPQGGIKFRGRAPGTEFGYARPRDRLPYWRSPFRSPFSNW
jgi:L,D-transpeptidase catalytic domain